MIKNKKLKNKVKELKQNVIMFFVLLLMFSLVTSNVSAKKDTATSNLTVNSSDTLWSIASNITDKNTNLNIQKVIYDIKDINGLKTSDIYVGQQLSIPIY